MSCGAGVWCKWLKDETQCRLMNETRKTGPRNLAPDGCYEGGTLLTLDADGVTYIRWTSKDQEIKAILHCSIDTTDWAEACSVGVVLQGCVNADCVAWPEGITQEDIDCIVACQNCCIVFEYDAGGCIPAPEDEKAVKKVKQVEAKKKKVVKKESA